MPLPASEVRQLVARLADRRVGRTEANVQSDLHMLLAAGPLDLGDDKLRDIILESPAGQRRPVGDTRRGSRRRRPCRPAARQVLTPGCQAMASGSQIDRRMGYRPRSSRTAPAPGISNGGRSGTAGRALVPGGTWVRTDSAVR